MAITVSQIAELCGVSRTTALRALNNQGRVSAETKAKVLRVARENGYRPNLLARSLNQGRTMTIGVMSINMDNMYFVQTLNVINKEAEKRGYFANIVVPGDSLSAEKDMIQQLADRKMEGLILSPQNIGKEFEDFLLSLEIPIVCIGNKVSNQIATIRIDEKRAMYEATIYAIEKGYNTIVLVCPPLEHEGEQNIFVHQERLKGFKEAVDKYTNKVDSGVIGVSDYIGEVEKLLLSHKKRCAIICSGDIYALNIMKWAREKDLSMPKDFGLMGFDNISMLDYVNPGLTTVSTCVEEVARVSVETLIAQIEGREIAEQNFQFKIIERETL